MPKSSDKFTELYLLSIKQQKKASGVSKQFPLEDKSSNLKEHHEPKEKALVYCEDAKLYSTELSKGKKKKKTQKNTQKKQKHKNTNKQTNKKQSGIPSFLA